MIQLSKEYIINKYGEIAIFSKYLSIPTKDIIKCINNESYKINNPLRDDIDPSLGFMVYNDNRLRMKDFAKSIYTGDIFYIVGLIIELNSKTEFNNICKNIITTMSSEKLVKIPERVRNRTSYITTIDITVVEYTYHRLKYWTDAQVTKKHLQYRNVYCLNTAIINDRVRYRYNSKDLGYGYYLGNIDGANKYKLYFPFRDKKNKTEPRFYSNYNKVLEAAHELYKAETLIITKSRKDKLCLEAVLIDKGNKTIIERLLAIHTSSSYTGDAFYFCVTSSMAENITLSREIVDSLKSMYNEIIINFDFDYQGIITAYYHYIGYGIKCIFYGNDLSYKTFSYKEVKIVLDKIYNDFNIKLDISNFKEFVEFHNDSFTTKDTYELLIKEGKKANKIINQQFDYEYYCNR